MAQTQVSGFVEREEIESILKLPHSWSIPEWVSNSAADGASGVVCTVAVTIYVEVPTPSVALEQYLLVSIGVCVDECACVARQYYSPATPKIVLR